jgi:endoglycosylceramidase
VLKKPDYLPIEDHFDFDMSLTDIDFQYMQEWGTKLIRLGVMWESVETSPGSYDMDYLDKVESLINKFGDAGIAVIVDNHQDLFSRQLCGEGVPYFYTPTDIDHECPSTLLGFFFQLAGRCESLQSYNMETDENGNPLFSECLQHSFEDMYTAPEVASAFDALYSNEDGLLDKLFDFWRVVSNRFKSNPNVIGYDIINEPWPANIYKEQSLFFEPTKFDTERLYPIAQRAHSVVREADDAKAIFFEAAQFPDTEPFLGGITLPIGFPETPGGIDYLNRQALNDHTYCCQAAGWMCNNGEPPLNQSNKCRAFHQ